MLLLCREDKQTFIFQSISAVVFWTPLKVKSRWLDPAKTDSEVWVPPFHSSCCSACVQTDGTFCQSSASDFRWEPEVDCSTWQLMHKTHRMSIDSQHWRQTDKKMTDVTASIQHRSTVPDSMSLTIGSLDSRQYSLRHRLLVFKQGLLRWVVHIVVFHLKPVWLIDEFLFKGWWNELVDHTTCPLR